MFFNSSRIEREKKTIEKMVAIYCKLTHSTNGNQCNDCSELLNYARARLDNCPFEEEKPPCNNCTIHCYRNDMRERIRQVMRFSGPKMMARHPWLAIMHVFYSRYEQAQMKECKSKK